MAEVGAPVTQNLGTIDPSSLIGRADPNIVTPQATAMLADAFRQGVVSADDVISRIGQLGQTKKKAEIDIAGSQSMLAQEAMSPEAVEARAQGLATQTAQGQLSQAKAEREKILSQYPAVEYFDKLAAKAGIETPLLPDGSPDYKEMEKIGLELALDLSNKTDAQAKLDNIVTKETNDGNVLSAFTKQAEFVDPKEVARLRGIATKPFSRQAPGTVQVAPVVEARNAVPLGVAEPTSVSPLPTVGGPVPAGTLVAGGYSLGNAPKVALPKAVDPVERAQQLASAQSQISQIAAARAAVARGAATGPLEGSTPVKILNNVAAALGMRESAYEDQRDLQIVLSQKVLEGAQLMKGNLSDKDIRFLEASVPKLKDTNNTWNTFLDRWDRMTKLNADILSGRTPPSVTDLFAPKDWEAGSSPVTAAPASATPAFNSPAEVPATTQFVVGPNGKKYVNPNYRP